MEFVPADEAIYCFIGKPPSVFGMVWFRKGKEHNLKTVAQEKGLSAEKLQSISLSLGEACTKYMTEPKYGTAMASKQVIVHPSDSLRNAVAEIIRVLE
jgi:hypothetical protein